MLGGNRTKLCHSVNTQNDSLMWWHSKGKQVGTFNENILWVLWYMHSAVKVLGDFLKVFQIPVKLNNTLDIRLLGDLWTNCSVGLFHWSSVGFIHPLDFARRGVIVDRGVCSTCTYTVFMCAQMSVVQAVRSSPSVYIHVCIHVH
jgi:hypothetical protein